MISRIEPSTGRYLLHAVKQNNLIKKTHEKFTRNSDNRDARLLIEAVNSSNESIHKHAANIAKMEAVKSNDETKDMVAAMLFELATKNNNNSHTDFKQITDTSIKIPDELVEGELFIGSGTLELDDIKEQE